MKAIRYFVGLIMYCALQRPPLHRLTILRTTRANPRRQLMMSSRLIALDKADPDV